jgi:hypothetical protein
MSDLDEDVRLAIFRSYVDTGCAPERVALGEAFSADAAAIDASLERLHGARHVVLGGDGAIAMAHPFASIPLGFSVMGTDTLWWGGCAWDAFAIPHLVASDAEVLVATQCPGCGRPHAWVVNREAAPVGDQVAHFLVPTSRIWDDVIHACGNQRIFCSVECVERWAETSGVEPGYVMDLATLWRLAMHWYDGRLERDYKRREPEHAREYFREVGLSGPFWGLE